MLDLNRSLPPTRESVVAIARGQLGESDASVYWRDSEHMTPGFKVNHLPHGALADTKALGQGNGGFSKRMSSASLTDQFWVEFGAADIYATDVSLNSAPLSDHVCHVFCLGPLKKVVRFYTRRIVTSVTDVLCRETAGSNSPGYPVREFRSVRVREEPVALSIQGASPHPAPIALLDLAPEACDSLFIHGISPAVGHDPGRANAAGSIH